MKLFPSFLLIGTAQVLWFGPLDAAGWHALAAGHMGIHRVQIERIVKGFPTASE